MIPVPIPAIKNPEDFFAPFYVARRYISQFAQRIISYFAIEKYFMPRTARYFIPILANLSGMDSIAIKSNPKKRNAFPEGQFRRNR